MFRLKSNALQREFKVNEGYLYASRIRNTRSGMDLVPDGNSTEFTFHFTDGTEFSSKGLKVTDSAERDGKLVFTFEEFEGITVTMRYWVGRDGNTLKKQLQFIQATEDKVIDYIALEHIGVINSQTHFLFRTTWRPACRFRTRWRSWVSPFTLTACSSAVSFRPRTTVFSTASVKSNTM